MERIIIYTFLQSVLCFSLFAQNSMQTSARFAVKTPQEIFVGGIMKANNLNDAEHQFLKVRMNPITMIYSFPVKSETIIPSYDNMVKTIEQRLVENDVLKPNYQFSFTIKQISSYLQLYPYFGEEIDLFSYFGITSRHLTSRTAAILDISQSFFSVNMDLPENLSDDPQVHEQMDELIYVNSIEFGRRTVLVVESNVGYQDLSVALNELLDNASDEAGKVSEKSKSIIANSIIRGLILDPLAKENMTPDNPLKYLINYMNTKVTSGNFGVPIFFTAAWLKDNATFVNKYSY